MSSFYIDVFLTLSWLGMTSQVSEYLFTENALRGCKLFTCQRLRGTADAPIFYGNPKSGAIDWIGDVTYNYLNCFFLKSEQYVWL